MIVNDITQLNPTTVLDVIKPTTEQEAILAVTSAIEKGLALSIAGGRFSMGGQSSVAGTVNLDITGLNQIHQIDLQNNTITVGAGCTWYDIQKALDPLNRSVSIMQTYSNFTVGGSLSVNVHGRYIGKGSIIASVKKILVVLADTRVVEASPNDNSDIFYACIGGYGAIGVILRATLEIAQNVAVKQVMKQMSLLEYFEMFKTSVDNNSRVIFHNADIHMDTFNSVTAVSWEETTEAPTQTSLMPRKKPSKLYRYLTWAYSESPLGHWRRRKVHEPLFYSKKRIYSRNAEASYDATELEPISREKSTFVLQEYFIPVRNLLKFVPAMGDIFKSFDVKVLNVSIRHAKKDPGSVMAWAKEDVFCFVVYYKEERQPKKQKLIPIWTRKLIDLALSCEGRYYLPYQPHATYEQFIKAYPGAVQLFEMKARIDKNFSFKNSLWNKYYQQYLDKAQVEQEPTNKVDFLETVRANEFNLLTKDVWSDNLYHFLTSVFGVTDSKKFWSLIKQHALAGAMLSREQVYANIVKDMSEVTSFTDAFKALSSLFKQKGVISGQVAQFNLRPVNSYLEIGTTGRYLKGVAKAMGQGSRTMQCSVLNDVAPSFSPVELVDVGFKKPVFIDLNQYSPLTNPIGIKYDLISCFVGLHHAPKHKLDEFVASIANAITEGGHFILRDHDCASEEMKAFVSLIHSVFNIGTGVDAKTDTAELRYFEPLTYWVDLLAKHGMVLVSEPIYQDNDPSLNALMCFRKTNKVD